MPHVVETVSAGELKFEIYDDGDCVLINSPGGFVQLSRSLIARLAGNGVPSGQASARKSEGATLTVTGPANVRKVETGPGWQCTFQDGGQTICHVYETRTQARAGSLKNRIGVAGRIA